MLHDMLAFIFENDVGLTKGKARTVASYFADLESFIEVSRDDLREIRGIGGRRTVRLSPEQIDGIIGVITQGLVVSDRPVSDNYLSAISRSFTKRQLGMIRSLNLDSLNPNPFLIKTLNLHTVEEVIRLNVYMFSTRSIVTSMGFFVEKLLLASSDSVVKGPRGSGWDLVKEDGNHRHWVQVKSGPNDMDRDQIVFWSRKIQEKLDQGDRAYIGITYGKRENETISLGFMRQLLPDWELTTLIGIELWDFISEDPTYHTRLFDILREAAVTVLTQNSICEEIEDCIERVKVEFVTKFGDGEEGVERYLEAIF